MGKYKVGDMIHPISESDSWNDVACQVTAIDMSTGKERYLVTNGRGYCERFFTEEELESVSKFIFRRTVKKINEDSEFAKKVICIGR